MHLKTSGPTRHKMLRDSVRASLFLWCCQQPHNQTVCRFGVAQILELAMHKLIDSCIFVQIVTTMEPTFPKNCLHRSETTDPLFWQSNSIIARYLIWILLLYVILSWIVRLGITSKFHPPAQNSIRLIYDGLLFHCLNFYFFHKGHNLNFQVSILHYCFLFCRRNTFNFSLHFMGLYLLNGIYVWKLFSYFPLQEHTCRFLRFVSNHLFLPLLKDYWNAHPEVTVLDPPQAIQQVHNRQSMLQDVADLNLSDRYGNFDEFPVQ